MAVKAETWPGCLLKTAREEAVTRPHLLLGSRKHRDST